VKPAEAGGILPAIPLLFGVVMVFLPVFWPLALR
jgi:hypothetical protein